MLLWHTRSFSCSILTVSCGMWDLIPQPGIGPRPPSLGVQSLSHWPTREVLRLSLLSFVVLLRLRMLPHTQWWLWFLVTWLFLTLATPWTSPSGSSVCRIFQARILGVGCHFLLQGIPDPGIQPGSPAIAGRFFTD